MGRDLPTEIRTGCSELDRVWGLYAKGIVEGPGVGIPDTDEHLTWHAFLGHSIDMQGTRAGEFVGVDDQTRPRADFRSLQARGIGVGELADLWKVQAVRQRMLIRTGSQKDAWSHLDDETRAVLSSAGGSAGRSLAEALGAFGWPGARRNWFIRALLENSAALEADGFSFRRWLRRECEELGLPPDEFPPKDFRQTVEFGMAGAMPLEEALRRRVGSFYWVAWTMAAYTMCDWQLWLWARESTGVFATFKWDSRMDDFVKQYCHGVVPTKEADFARWWLDMYPGVPPRIINECIWLGFEKGVI
jgi:PAS domain-containing protein